MGVLDPLINLIKKIPEKHNFWNTPLANTLNQSLGSLKEGVVAEHNRNQANPNSGANKFWRGPIGQILEKIQTMGAEPLLGGAEKMFPNSPLLGVMKATRGGPPFDTQKWSQALADNPMALVGDLQAVPHAVGLVGGMGNAGAADPWAGGPDVAKNPLPPGVNPAGALPQSDIDRGMNYHLYEPKPVYQQPGPASGQTNITGEMQTLMENYDAAKFAQPKGIDFLRRIFGPLFDTTNSPLSGRAARLFPGGGNTTKDLGGYMTPKVRQYLSELMFKGKL